LLLRVAEVSGVVATAVTQVDPADEGDIALDVAAVPDDEQLLVMRPEPRYPLVEQHLRAGPVELRPESLVLLRAQVQVIGVRAPQQRTDLHSGPREVAQQVTDGRAVREQPLVGVAAPVGEVHPVAAAQDVSSSCSRRK
jgi:hypothetical protein